MGFCGPSGRGSGGIVHTEARMNHLIDLPGAEAWRVLISVADGNSHGAALSAMTRRGGALPGSRRPAVMRDASCRRHPQLLSCCRSAIDLRRLDSTRRHPAVTMMRTDTAEAGHNTAVTLSRAGSTLLLNTSQLCVEYALHAM